MSSIHVLPEAIANKIAAGEVVERPASIVKELLENALDAGADSIAVSIEHGGQSLIRVADNGKGMSGEDVELAFRRHATSKIETADDLTSIATFGFRGEALPSIAAVSRVRIRTRARGTQTGIEVVIDGGVVKEVKDCSCREGTIVEIRDLFFNTPARRKFLRTEATERGHIMDVVGNVALAMGALQISLQSGDKEIWNFSPEDKLEERACAVLGVPEVAEWLPLAAEAKGIRLSGLIGKPRMLRSNRSGQVFFVNRRMVKALSLSYALRDGYHGLLMHGQFPLGIIFVEVDPTQVDVNVHPTKQEVRLSHEKDVKTLLRRVVTECLGQAEDMVPFLRSSSKSPSVVGEGPRARPDLGHPQGGAPTEQRTWDLTGIPSSQATPDLDAPISFRNKLHITKILGQIHGTYLAVETEEGFLLVDQHAAHERVKFEELVQNLETGEVNRQGLLLNEVLELKPKQQELMQGALAFLQRLGFELDAFGDSEYVIRAVPATLRDADPVACLRAFLEQKEGARSRTDLDNHQEDIAALVACKRRSVKAHDVLQPAGMEALLAQLSQCDNPFNCPHGRPTIFQLTIDDLEKQFKRKV